MSINQRKARRSPTRLCLPLNVYPYRGKYRAQIRYSGKHFTLGSFQTPEEAGECAARWKAILHGLTPEEARRLVFDRYHPVRRSGRRIVESEITSRGTGGSEKRTQEASTV